MSNIEEVKPCPVCGGHGITRRHWRPLMPTWDALCLRCDFEMDLARWNHMPRREEVYAELMALACRLDSLLSQYQIPRNEAKEKAINKVAEIANKYGPEDGETDAD